MMMIVGLGNPGTNHAKQRHNIGFMAADEIVRRHNFSNWQKKFSGQISEGNLGGQKVLVLKPMTFMNLSGQSVGEAARFYKIAPADIIVIHDELDLAPAKIRVKTGGGHGGHNGLKSIDAHLGTKDYQRLRMGIGHPGHKDRVHSHVLGDFAKAEQSWLEPLLDDTARYIDLLLAGDMSSFMNKLSGHMPLETKKPKAEPKGKSHIHQARPKNQAGQLKTDRQAPLPKSGPMAEMLKKLLGNKE